MPKNRSIGWAPIAAGCAAMFASTLAHAQICDYDAIVFDTTKTMRIENDSNAGILWISAGGSDCIGTIDISLMDDPTLVPLTSTGASDSVFFQPNGAHTICVKPQATASAAIMHFYTTEAIATNGYFRASFNASQSCTGVLDDDGPAQPLPCPDFTTTGVSSFASGFQDVRIPFTVPDQCSTRVRVRMELDGTGESSIQFLEGGDFWETISDLSVAIEGLEDFEHTRLLTDPDFLSSWDFIPPGDYVFVATMKPKTSHTFSAPCGNDYEASTTLHVDGLIHLEFGFNCPADLDCDGIVGTSDLISLLNSWGPCQGCRADLDCNGVVDFNDQIALLGSWGTCE